MPGLLVIQIQIQAMCLPKRPINQFRPVWQSRQQLLRGYSPNIYTVQTGPKDVFMILKEPANGTFALI